MRIIALLAQCLDDVVATLVDAIRYEIDDYDKAVIVEALDVCIRIIESCKTEVEARQ